MFILLYLDQKAKLFQLPQHVVATAVPILSLESPRALGHDTVEVDHLDLIQLVPLADLVIVGVMGGSDLDRATAHFRIRVLVGDDGNLPIHQRQHHPLAHGRAPALVAGMNVAIWTVPNEAGEAPLDRIERGR